MMSSGKRKWWIMAGILAGSLLLWNPLADLIFSVRFALSLQKLASGETGGNLEVKQVRVVRQMAGRSYEALLYNPARLDASKAIILSAGLSELGCYHPRLVALSRFLADRGFMVITPDIRQFRAFQISAEPIDQMLFWYGQVAKLEGGAGVKKTGLAGISYSGTLALIAAATPQVRETVGFVVAVGPYSSLSRCTRNWFAASPRPEASRYYPTRFYAKWIIMMAALDMIEAPGDRQFLRGVLHKLLLQQKVPPAPLELTAPGARWYRLATMPDNQSDPELAHSIEAYLSPRIYARLDPGQVLDGIRCPVFLIHGAYDDLIPPEESAELHRNLARSHLLILSFLTHTHPTAAPLSRMQKVKAGFEALVFCYQLSRASH